MLWGGGTAIGEIPPYAFSYQAAMADKGNKDFDRLFQASGMHMMVPGLAQITHDGLSDLDRKLQARVVHVHVLYALLLTSHRTVLQIMLVSVADRMH